MADFKNNPPNTSSKQVKSPVLPIVLGVFGVGSLAAVGLLVAARAFFFEVRYIPSGSMQPTLQVNDRIFVDKWIYNSQEPKRGDVIIFMPTEALQKQNFRDAFVKRVVGLPGETIEVKQGQVFINSHPLPEPYITEKPNYQWGPMVIPVGQYAVFGDNRNNAYDSHYWGFVPRQLIIGKATQIFSPPDRVGPIK